MSQNNHEASDLRRSPSQVFALSTTVPLRLSSPERNACRRHRPTRRALRRSRLLNSTAGSYRQPAMHNCKVAAMFVFLQLVFGISLTGLAFYTSTLTPSLKVRDVPSWAGIPLAFTGLLGVLFVSCCHKEYPGNNSVFAMKAFTFTLSSLSVVLCLCAAAFNAIHLMSMSTYTSCIGGREKPINGCECHVAMQPRDRIYRYEEISCEDVAIVLRILFIVMSVVACLGAAVSLWFDIIMWSSRYEPFYAGLKANEDECVPQFATS